MKLKSYNIAFAGLKDGKHEFTYEIDNTFFENYGFTDFNSADLFVTATLDKRSTLMEIFFEVSGTVNINCHVTNEPFNLPLSDDIKLVIKFGQEFNDENEELLILPHGEYEVNIAQYIYELIALAVPVRIVHPDVENGTLDSEILNRLKELEPKGVIEKEVVEEQEQDIDPRWEALKKLKTDNNI